MAKFLPGGYLYYFIGVASALFLLMFGCFVYYKGKSFLKKNPIQKKAGAEGKGNFSFKRKTKKNKFVNKRAEGADGDEEDGAAETKLDKARADIDAKFNNNMTWFTETSGEVHPPSNESTS